MDHNGIPFGLHFHQQPAHPAVAHSHLLGHPFLRNLPFFDAFQPIQPIPFLLAHRDSFHPSSLAAVKRNFLLCPIRNFSLCRDTAQTDLSPARIDGIEWASARDTQMKPAKLTLLGVLAALLCLALFTVGVDAQNAHDAVLKNLKFRSIGPATMGGRVDDLAVVESDPRIIYVGAAAGGIFKSVNGGNTWQSIF